MTAHRSHARRALRSAFALSALLLLPSLAGAADWKGTEETVDGVVHVKNPATAIDPPMTIELDEVFRLGGWDGGDDEFFGVISDIAVDDDGNLYVLDAQLNEIKIYAADGSYVNTIGRAGEGPGEFRGATALFWLPTGDLGVMQAFPSRIVTMSRDGVPGEDLAFEQPEGSGFMVATNVFEAGENLAVNYMFREFIQAEQKFVQTTWLAIFSPDGKEMKRLHSKVGGMDFKNPVVSEEGFDSFANRLAVSPDGSVYATENLTDYRLLVWNPDGTQQRVIERAYEPHARTQDEIDELLAIYKGFTPQGQVPPNTTYAVNDNHPPIDGSGVHVRPDGSVWVLTSRGSDDDADEQLGTFDIFDPKGRFVRQATLTGQCDNENDRIFFVGDRILVVTDFLSAAMAAQGGANEDEDAEEAEPMSVICFRSDDLSKAANIPARPAD